MGYQPLPPKLVPVTHPEEGMDVTIKYPNGFIVEGSIIGKTWLGRWKVATRGRGDLNYIARVRTAWLYRSVTVPSVPPRHH